MKESIYLYGKNPLKEALLAITRGNKNLLHKVFLTKQGEADPTIMSLIQSYAISYDIVTADEIEHMVGKGTVHQGVCIKLNEDALYTPLDVVLQESNGSSKNKLIILLDELQDPHNVGAIIRSAVAFGASAILLPEHDQTQINGTVIKTSSGMNFAIPIVRIGNVNTTLSKLKERGYWIYGLAGDGKDKLSKTTFDSNTALIVGSEGKGIKQKTLELCDFRLSIELNPLCESLNASNAAAVTLYEWSKQNNDR